MHSYTRIGLISGNAAVVMAEPARLADLETSLRAAGVNFDECLRSGQLTLLDADALLAKIMDGDMPNAEAFRKVVGDVLTGISARGYRQTRVYGELVYVLWRDGNPVAAIALEEYWNELAFEHRFSLFCGYEMEGLSETQHEVKQRPPADRTTMLWLRRNMPGAVGKVVARARIHYGKD